MGLWDSRQGKVGMPLFSSAAHIACGMYYTHFTLCWYRWESRRLDTLLRFWPSLAPLGRRSFLNSFIRVVPPTRRWTRGLYETPRLFKANTAVEPASGRSTHDRVTGGSRCRPRCHVLITRAPAGCAEPISRLWKCLLVYKATAPPPPAAHLARHHHHHLLEASSHPKAHRENSKHASRANVNAFPLLAGKI